MAFSFFFRDEHSLRLAARLLERESLGRQKVRVWDAGCALGQESYTFAILLAEQMGPFAFRNLLIDATDLDPQGAFGPIVRAGCYSYDELKRIPARYLERYFSSADGGKTYQLERLLRERVRFARHDLRLLEPPGQGYALVICKNVLLHLAPAERVAVLRMFHASLAPGGLVVTERTQAMPPELARHFERADPEARLYRRREIDDSQARAA